MKSSNVFADLEEVGHDHRPHGSLTADATSPDRMAILLIVAGVMFERWITPWDTELELLGIAGLN